MSDKAKSSAFMAGLIRDVKATTPDSFPVGWFLAAAVALAVVLYFLANR